MRPLVFIALSICALPVTDVRGAEPVRSIPAEIRGRGPTGLPAWVSIDVAVDPQGKLRLEKVGEHSVRMLRDMDALRRRNAPSGELAMTSEGCHGSTSLPAVDHYRRNETLNDLVAEASDVVVGRVMATGEGFFRGHPATILRVAITETYRSSNELAGRTEDLFLVYPFANVRIGASLHCTRPVGFTFEPAVGNRVLLFKYLPSASPDALLVEADAGREVIFEAGNRTVVPPVLASDAQIREARTFGDLMGIVRNAVSERDGGAGKQKR
jgi:hypothetical protein